MKVGLLFDLDGTLLDNLQDLTYADNYALAQLGLPQRTVAQVRSFVGNGAKVLLQRAVGEGQPWQEAYDIFRPYYDAHCQCKTRPYDGILEVLASLRQAYPVAVVSNKPDSAVKALCAQYFPGIFALGEQTGCPRKPAPDMLYRAMGALNVDHCIYIGDSEVDVLTAHNAGVPCLSVLWGFRDAQTILAAGETRLCQAPGQLPEMIEEMVGNINGK